MYEFKFPDVGEGIHEGVIIKWRVKEGDSVKEDQTLVEMETAKAIVEIPCPKAGIILKRNGNEGDTVKVGDILVAIGVVGEKSQPKMPIGAGVPARPKFAAANVGVVGELPEAPPEDVNHPVGARPVAPAGLPDRSSPQRTKAGPVSKIPPAIPAVRKLAQGLNINLSMVRGTGINGMITMEDVIAAVSNRQTMQQPIVKKHRKYELYGEVEHTPLSGMRKTIAEHMVASQFTKPHVTHGDTCDVTALVEYREKQKEIAAKKGVKLTFLPFIIKAVVAALKEYPIVASEFDDEKQEIVMKKYYNIGIAVDTEDGLMVPVIKNADKKSIYDLAKEIEDLAAKARGRKIDLAELQGGSFTITNVGSIGGEFFTPIINTDQAAILGVGAIKEQPTVYEGKIVPRKILHLSVSFDHRIIDGAVAARFLNAVMRYITDPAAFTI